MKITDRELRKIIREVVKRKVAKLKEASDFTARRQVVHSAEAASMNFEQEIIKLLGLEHPDNLSPELQKRYYVVVDTMQDKIKSAVMEATRELAAFPKPREDGQK